MPAGHQACLACTFAVVKYSHPVPLTTPPFCPFALHPNLQLNFASSYGRVPLILPESYEMSTESYYMGVDVGTGSARVCLIDEFGNLRAIQTKKIETWNPRTNFYVGYDTTNTIGD